ncbi:MAG: hypothetical protein KKE86_09430 [Planctomycetes bacterium]|nr:hypothetical protein [Planctomycetota bacterium]
MAIPGQFPPNLIFLIGILEPVQWTVAPRPWYCSSDVSADVPLKPPAENLGRKRSKTRGKKPRIGTV